jgi:signal transduction histidine kinase
MSDPLRRLSAPQDPKGLLVSILVGAVLLPSIGLSVVSLSAIPDQAKVTRATLLSQAEKVLHYAEEELEHHAHDRALEAAHVVGTQRLLEGRWDQIRTALVASGMDAGMFDSLRLETSSPSRFRAWVHTRERSPEGLRETLSAIDVGPGSDEESIPLTAADGAHVGTLRFRLSAGYAHGRLLRDYFEKEFSNPDKAMVIRATEPDGTVVYETAPTRPDIPFELRWVMMSPSFKGMKLYLRYRDRSIQDEVNRWATVKRVLIGFIDMVLLAGLYLVYSNVRREARLARLKSDFVANVSHELKTPLALIRLFAETLEMGRVSGEGKAREYYRIINKESQRLTQLINNILDFSRIEAGRKEYRFERTDLNQIVQEVLDAYRFPIEQQGFTLEVQVPEDLPEVEVDKEALAQALLNLVNNAIKYSRDEKHLRIELRRAGDKVRIEVADRGIGIPKAEQRKIFEKFYRAEDSLVQQTRGSGLGLSLVRHIMEAHGGEVDVESTPGKGSTFTLVLPIERKAA